MGVLGAGLSYLSIYEQIEKDKKKRGRARASVENTGSPESPRKAHFLGVARETRRNDRVGPRGRTPLDGVQILGLDRLIGGHVAGAPGGGRLEKEHPRPIRCDGLVLDAPRDDEELARLQVHHPLHGIAEMDVHGPFNHQEELILRGVVVPDVLPLEAGHLDVLPVQGPDDPGHPGLGDLGERVSEIAGVHPLSVRSARVRCRWRQAIHLKESAMELLISIVSGLLGGNLAGLLNKAKSLGPIINSVLGAGGGALGGLLGPKMEFLANMGQGGQAAAGGALGFLLPMIGSLLKKK